MDDKILFDKILSGIVSGETNRVEKAKEVQRNIAYFANMSVPGVKADNSFLSVLTLFGEYENHKRVAEVACKYNEQTGSFLDQDILGQVLKSRGLEPKEVTSMMYIFDVCSKAEVEENGFRFWVRELVDHARALPLADSLANAMQALESQYVDPKTSVIYKGPDAALELIDNVRTLPGMVDQNIHSMPSGDIRLEMAEILQESDEAAAGVKPAGTIYSGFRFVDEATDGFSPGDLILVGAHTGEGKSQFATNCGWFAAVEQGRNVLIITLETARKQYRRRLLCRHSNKPSVGKIGGVPYKNVKTGQFVDKQEKELWVKVVQDFCTNPGYGVLDVTQATEGMTMEEVSAKARSFEDRHGVPLHMIIVDYLALMGSKRMRKGRQEELNDILRESKGFATSFDNGRGVVLMAPHQTKQSKREIVKPENGKFYTVRDFSDTSEAGKTIDVGIMLLRNEELEEVHELAASLVKCRDAESPPQIVRLYERYSSSFIGNLSSSE